MGANQFFVRGEGEVAEAFRKAVTSARYDCGYGGYAGTIAEKSSFEVLTAPIGVDPYYFMRCVLEGEVLQGKKETPQAPDKLKELQAAAEKGFKFVDDKWGPAGAIEMEPKKWVFFGWASS